MLKIIQSIVSFGAGGAETIVKDLSVGFHQKGYNVLVVIIDKLSHDPSEVSKTAELKKMGVDFVSLGRKKGEKSFMPLIKILKIINNFKPDIIHVHCFLSAFYFLPFTFTKKIRCFKTIHNTLIFENAIQKFIYCKVIKSTFNLIFCSKESEISLSNYLGKGKVINNGVRNIPFKNIRQCLQKKHNLVSSDLILLAVGRISVQKNQLLLLKTIEKLNLQNYKGKVHLLICGKNFEDNYGHEINSYLKSMMYSSNIHFLNVRTDIVDLMHSVDIFISSSIFEGLPLTVLEAMNTGVPMILSPINEHYSLFHDLPGAIFPKENTFQGFYEVLKEKLFFEPKEILISKRLNFINEFSCENMVNSYLEEYISK